MMQTPRRKEPSERKKLVSYMCEVSQNNLLVLLFFLLFFVSIPFIA